MSGVLDVAGRAAFTSGEMLKKLQKGRVAYKTKTSADDLVTKGDLQSEKIILDMIKKNFPKHGYISEEAGEYQTDAEYVWVLDPVDGTIAFASGMPTYAVSIGVLRKGKPYMGVINTPSLGDIYYSQAGKGAFLNGRKITVSSTKEIGKAIVGSDLERAEKRIPEHKKVHMPIISKARYVPMLGAAATGMAFVSVGVYDAYVKEAKLWDFVAGAVLVTEAGGQVTDYRGKPIDWTKRQLQVLASNGLVHGEILALIKE